MHAYIHLAWLLLPASHPSEQQVTTLNEQAVTLNFRLLILSPLSCPSVITSTCDK